jgi:hypothetical protein
LSWHGRVFIYLLLFFQKSQPLLIGPANRERKYDSEFRPTSLCCR